MAYNIETIETDKSSRRRSVVQSIWDVGVIGSLVLLAMTIPNRNFGDLSTSSPLKPIEPSEVVNKPTEFVGKTVTIRSRATKQVGNNSFLLEDGFWTGKRGILVVNASGIPFRLPSDRSIEIQVTGQVREFIISEIEDEYNLKLKDGLYGGYANQPVIVAQYIALAPVPGQVSQNPRRYYGQTVAITGEVESIESPVLMKLKKNQFFGGRDLPVLLTSSPKVAINRGQTVAVVGEVRPFIAREIEQKYQLDWDGDTRKRLEAEYGNSPVLVAENVYP